MNNNKAGFSLLSSTIFILVAVLALSACGGGGGSSEDVPRSSDYNTLNTVTGVLNSGSVNSQSILSNSNTAQAIRSAIGVASGVNPPAHNGAPTGITATRGAVNQADITFTPSPSTPWIRSGTAPGASTVPWFEGSKWTRKRPVVVDDPPSNPDVPETVWVWTDIDGPSAEHVTVGNPLDRDTNSDESPDAIDITAARLNLVSNIGRAPEDPREDDAQSVNPVDRGVFGEDRTFNQGHEISGRFNGAYGLYSCVSTTCSINISSTPGVGITEMRGWVFTPKSETGAGGGTRPPQILVPDNDYQYFGIWLRGPDPSADDGFEVATFSGGSQPFTGTVTALSGRAFYSGPVAGQYVQDSGSSSSTGLFTAKAQLQATFGGTPGVTGTLSDFRDGSRDLGWSLTLQRAPVSGVNFSGVSKGLSRAGTYRGTTGYEDKGNDNFGRWQGQFNGNRNDGYPDGISGRFNARFDDGLAVGAFGARKTPVP
ncbi:MAG: hypothetical protein OXG06_03670 [Gammaproteobacteria bacterium]|nr:hypothetical protein [Gammaproteobacteria bacterium]